MDNHQKECGNLKAKSGCSKKVIVFCVYYFVNGMFPSFHISVLLWFGLSFSLKLSTDLQIQASFFETWDIFYFFCPIRNNICIFYNVSLIILHLREKYTCPMNKYCKRLTCLNRISTYPEQQDVGLGELCSQNCRHGWKAFIDALKTQSSIFLHAAWYHIHCKVTCFFLPPWPSLCICISATVPLASILF